ncbi:MAG: 30S ribosomal protein S2 [Candidatus Hodarchaeota archaeon]
MMIDDELLVPRELYIDAGVHFGTAKKTSNMEPYIYKTINIGRRQINLIDIRKTAARIRVAAKFISRYHPNKVLVTSKRRYGHQAIKKFSEIIGSKYITGQIKPGTLTNYSSKHYIEADLLIIIDPKKDIDAINESSISKIPIICLSNTDNNFINVDLVIPANNRGKKALALIFWILTRQVLLERSEINFFSEFNFPISDFL